MGWSLEDGRRQSWCKKMKKENRQIELQWITLIAEVNLVEELNTPLIYYRLSVGIVH